MAGSLASQIKWANNGAEQAQKMADFTERELEKLKCCKCSRTIAKVSPGTLLRSGARVEIKCGSCNSFNHIIGPADCT